MDINEIYDIVLEISEFEYVSVEIISTQEDDSIVTNLHITNSLSYIDSEYISCLLVIIKRLNRLLEKDVRFNVQDNICYITELYRVRTIDIILPIISKLSLSYSHCLYDNTLLIGNINDDPINIVNFILKEIHNQIHMSEICSITDSYYYLIDCEYNYIIDININDSKILIELS